MDSDGPTPKTSQKYHKIKMAILQETKFISDSERPAHFDQIVKIRLSFKTFLSKATGYYHDLIVKISDRWSSLANHANHAWVTSKLNPLKQFIEQCKSSPSILSDPSLSFFRDYLESLGAQLPHLLIPNRRAMWMAMRM